MTPTVEQEAIVEAFKAGKSLVVEAGAGAAKSTTLRLCAESSQKKLGIYLAYNKALATDAQAAFPRNTYCKTSHSLAYATEGRRMSHRLNGPRVPTWQVTKFLGVPREEELSPRVKLTDYHITRLVLDGISKFYNGAETEPGVEHIWNPGGWTSQEMQSLRDLVLPFLQKAWEDLSAEQGKLYFTHDTYLKKWALTNPTIGGDFIFLDESQDCNPCLAGVLKRQSAQMVVVGDQAQAIYGFRGTVDLMEEFPDSQRLTLSKSFRFGEPIAAEANKWLGLLGSKLSLKGNEAVESRITEDQGASAVLCRTNAEAMGQCLDLLARDRKVALVGGGEKIKAMAEAAIQLKAGERPSHPELFLFKSWGELQNHVAEEKSAQDLKVFVKLVDNHGAQKLIRAVNQLSDEKTAEVVVSTAHKAKGREWNAVRIAQDFPRPTLPSESKKGEETKAPSKEDLQIAYVATTRAKNTLNRGGLSWVDKWLREIKGLCAQV